ncbi:MAG: LuxR C-terminal-related transcriptional regulator [candidate division Zixibacteria bacterium]|nr:LuxR C-terminal-related transcriptional regulator [candidate division Zixibacteria bacterium]MDH3937275.1 LuxR C-terminal-related transcriptional regulator [candidate division Zixibacteria bacterium]MDH4034294.1 LuxR C-terminal-related transcriptional regulator [candidate division Zixibacteria bacterium]
MKQPENRDSTTVANEPEHNQLSLEGDTDLAESNRRLQEEIADRCQAEADLAIANQILEAKHQELHERNVALQQVLSRIEEEKTMLAFQVRTNIDRLIKPIVRALEDKADPVEKRQLQLLATSLEQATKPLGDKLQSIYASLTPREVEISNMVKNGLTSKQAGTLLGLSEATIRKHRRNIRKKLGIANQQQNLSSYLKTL